jgi:hypothetical protein
MALEAASLGSVLGLFLISELLKRCSYICSVNIHGDMFVVVVRAGALTGVLVCMTVM